MARRTRSPHPGVILIPPKGEHATWRARCDDPDTDGRTWERLDPVALRTAEARRQWAIKRSVAIAKRKMDLAAGVPRATGTALGAAVDTYFDDHPNLRESTRALYRQHADTFAAWAAREGLAKGDDLTRERLVAFRASRVRVKRKTAVEGGEKGQKTTTDTARAPSTVNVELRAVRAVLGYLRERGLVARLSSDDLRDGLKRLDAPTERIEVLKPAELRRLIEAALRHDSETFAATREEHAGNATPGSTPRYPAVAPLVAGMLLSGMRADEGISLEWGAVDLADGEIALTTRTKTAKPREIDLAVSPALSALLAALKLRSGGKGPVFGLSKGEARAALRRLTRYGAPEFSWQTLRQSCGSYLTCAPGIFGSASAYHSARQLGHSVQVAERHYLGRVKGIPADARDIESAMQLGKPLAAIIAGVGSRSSERRHEPVKLGARNKHSARSTR